MFENFFMVHGIPPLRQGGFFVAFVPMRNGDPDGDQAGYRPIRLAHGPDGSNNIFPIQMMEEYGASFINKVNCRGL